MKKYITNKKIIATLTFSIAIAMSLLAQVNEVATITLTAQLNTTLAVNIATTGITFDFNTLEDYENGMGGKNGDYFSEGEISSTSNWQLGHKASGQFLHEDGTTIMPLDNIGVTIDFTGSNKIINNCKNQPLALAEAETVLLEKKNNQSNAGDGASNAFTIYWQLGTGAGNMNDDSLFEQDIKKGTYNVDVEFIVTEVL